jgi:hypothetical protein
MTPMHHVFLWIRPQEGAKHCRGALVAGRWRGKDDRKQNTFALLRKHFFINYLTADSFHAVTFFFSSAPIHFIAENSQRLAGNQTFFVVAERALHQ